MTQPLTAERLKVLLVYDPKTGLFRWIKGTGTAAAGAIAGALSPTGYLNISVDGRSYRAHRLVWLWMTGEWPKTKDLDHRNNDKIDNRFENLREATRSQNCANSKKRKTGLKGTTFIRRLGKYSAQITVNGARCWLGVFPTKEEAHAAYAAAAHRYFGEFARAA